MNALPSAIITVMLTLASQRGSGATLHVASDGSDVNPGTEGKPFATIERARDEILELFHQDQPMTLARWPNEGFITITEVRGASPVDVRGTRGCKEGVFSFSAFPLFSFCPFPYSSVRHVRFL